jgi:hypothetical protein
MKQDDVVLHGCEECLFELQWLTRRLRKGSCLPDKHDDFEERKCREL